MASKMSELVLSRTQDHIDGLRAASGLEWLSMGQGGKKEVAAAEVNAFKSL